MRIFQTYFFLFVTTLGFSQSTNLSLNKDHYHQLDRLEVLNLDSSSIIHSSFKPYRKVNLADYSSIALSGVDQFNLSFLNQSAWLINDSIITSKKSILKHFYTNPFALYNVKNEFLKLSINPVIYFQGGKETKQGDRVSINTRGLEIEGLIDNKVAFYSFVGENQIFAPQYFSDRVIDHRAIPGEGFWKFFKETGYDFFTARAYIDFNITKHISLQAGQDQNFVGNGYRSMILSNNATSYPFVKLQTKVWKFNYTNLFAKLTADLISTSTGPTAGSEVYPRKWLSFHHLSLDVTDNINIGVFESIMSGAHDSTGRSGFEVDYLNPVIFYRSVEQNLGSEGNAMIGLDFKWNFLKSFSMYGQVVLDEFHLSNMKAQDGWWANKQAIQLGLKYFNVAGIKNLDLQLEHNYARPFMYSHATNYTSYTHYRTELAHPLGANFNETIAIIRFQPSNKLTLVGKLIYMNKGEDDTDSTTWGGDILKSYTVRTQEFGNTVGQGVGNKTLYMSLRASYLVKPNLYLDLLGVVRKEDSVNDNWDNNALYVSLGLRLNIAQRLYDY